jgi:hypothetical protein
MLIPSADQGPTKLPKSQGFEVRMVVVNEVKEKAN